MYSQNNRNIPKSNAIQNNNSTLFSLRQPCPHQDMQYCNILNCTLWRCCFLLLCFHPRACFLVVKYVTVIIVQHLILTSALGAEAAEDLA